MGNTQPKPLLVFKPLLIDLQPKVGTIALGAGFRTAAVFTGADLTPLGRIRYTVATGTPTMSSFGNTAQASGLAAHFATSLSSSDLSTIAPLDPDAHAYTNVVNGKDPPRAWADAMALATDKALGSVLVTARAFRVDADGHVAQLRPEKQGTDWNRGDVDHFVRFAHYTRYFAYVVMIRFDSDCKRDTYLHMANSATVDSILPATDTKGLGKFLVDAGAEIAVGVITLGQAAATQSALDTTTCAPNDLGACNALVTKLDALMQNVPAPALPTTFSATPEGSNDWFVDSFTHQSKSFLLP